MENDNGKIITFSFVGAGLVGALASRTLMVVLASRWGLFARYYGHDWVQHGVPVVVAFLTFLALQMNGRIYAWADEVVMEIRKIVWPSRKDTIAMTFVVCAMLLAASLIIGVFDVLTSNLIRLVIN